MNPSLPDSCAVTAFEFRYPEDCGLVGVKDVEANAGTAFAKKKTALATLKQRNSKLFLDDDNKEE